MRIVIYILLGLIIGVVISFFSFEKSFINIFYDSKNINNNFFSDDDDDDDDDDDEVNRLIYHNDKIAIKLSPEEIKSAGITVSKLDKGNISVKEEVNAISIEAKYLFDLYKQYEMLSINKNKKLIKKEFNEKKYLKLKSLYEEQGSVAFKEIEEVRLSLRLVENELSLLKKDMELLISEITLLYGKLMVNDILGNKKIINSLISNTSSLLILEDINNREDSIYKFNNAELIFLNTYSGKSNLRGNVGIYLAKNLNISAHSKIIISLDTDQNLHGYFLPKKSLVYYGGKIWVYATENNGIFYRIEVNNFTHIDKDRVFIPGEMLNIDFVNTGAQILLAEEFRSQIMQEDDD